MMPFISLESTAVTRSYGILPLVTPLGMGGALEGQIVSMVYLAVNIIKLSSETWYTIVNDRPGDHMMLYRSRIDDNLDEISHTCHLGLGAAAVRVAYEPGGMWCCGARSRSIPMI